MYQRPRIRGLKGLGKAAKTATILTAILVSVSFLVGLTAVAADEKIVLTMYGYSNSPIGYLSAAIGSVPMAADDIAAYEDERPIYEDFLACLDYARSHAYLIKRGVTMSKLGGAVKAVADGESPAQAVQDAVRKIEEDIRKFNERTK